MLKRIRIDDGFLILAAVLLLTVPLRWILAAFLAAFVHELGHGLAVWVLGGRVSGGAVSLRGARLDVLPMTPGRELLCALSGPAASFLLLCFAHLLPRIAICGLIQGVYNLLPIYPLDGGRAVRCLSVLLQERKKRIFSNRNGKFSCKDGQQRVQ